MPIKTSILDNGNFVCSPESPPKPAFSEYLGFADRLLAQWREAQQEQSRSPFSSEVVKKKGELDRVLGDFVETFKPWYTVKSVERDPAFVPVSRFLAQYRPLGEPFSILHCDREMPLHSVHEFPTQGDLARVNAALDEKTPFRWWQGGPHDRPCYLFGDSVWELQPSEIALSEPGKAVLFRDAAEDDRQKLDRLKNGRPQAAATADAGFIPEKVRVAVFRRAGGKCEKCGSRERLDYDRLSQASRGGDPVPENIRLLCSRCASKGRS
jgi:hypothetical protein